MDIYQCVPQYILVLFSECNPMKLDYIMFVSSVAAGANGIVTFTKILPKILETNNRRARDVFLTYVLKIISMLDEENASCTEKLGKVQEKQINDAESDELLTAAKAKRTVFKNRVMIDQAKNLFYAAKSSSFEIRKGQFFPCISFIFAFLSILVLVFSPQIANWKIHNFWLIFLFIPQLLALIMLIYASLQKYFPVKYIAQVFSVRKNVIYKLWDVICFEWHVFRYRPSNNRQVTKGIKLDLTISSSKK